jgi:hypothetical protein
MELVNGYVCNNCRDVELAAKGIDPLHPTNVHGREAFAKADDKASNAPPTGEPLGENQPKRGGPAGTRLNLLA